MHNHLVLFDGECGFCNFWIQWILKKDKKNRFSFSPLQSSYSQNILSECKLPLTDFDSIILISDGKVLQKMPAIIAVGKIIGGCYNMISILKIFPLSFQNGIYTFIAKNRHRIMPQQCVLPSPEQRKQFFY